MESGTSHNRWKCNARVIFIMSNPTHGIMHGLAKKAGASLVGTERRGFVNIINNVLAFPGIFIIIPSTPRLVSGCVQSNSVCSKTTLQEYDFNWRYANGEIKFKELDT